MPGTGLDIVALIQIGVRLSGRPLRFIQFSSQSAALMMNRGPIRMKLSM